MKDFKGTKGKWTYLIQDIADNVTIDNKGICQIIISETVNPDESEANARILAAAPELLESLSKLVEMLTDPSIIASEAYLYELDIAIEIAENVINKALGKEESHEF